MDVTDRVELLHVIEEPEVHEGPRHCDWCWEEWPCDARRLLDIIQAYRTAGIW